jgi:hypothetical protein
VPGVHSEGAALAKPFPSACSSLALYLQRIVAAAPFIGE